VLSSVLPRSVLFRSWACDLTSGCWDAFQIQRIAAG
ncbi:unnamed protein product, partial [Ectocarpus sp. 12 AP-2014]